MNYPPPDRDASARIAISDVQKQALAAALREARKEGRRYRRASENLLSCITAAKPVPESPLPDSLKFIL